MVETCGLDLLNTSDALNILRDGGELLGEDVNVTVVDKNGNIVENATIQFILPNGTILSYEEGFRTYEPGKWAVMADKDGYAPDYELFDVSGLGKGPKGAELGSGSNVVSDFFDWVTESATRSVLLLIAVIIAAILIIVFASRRKAAIKPEKI